MNQAEIALQLTLEAMKHFSTSNRVSNDSDALMLSKRTYTLYNSIYNNLFNEVDDSIKLEDVILND